MYPTKKLSEITSLITKWSTPTSYGYEFLPEWINFIKIENNSLHMQYHKEHDSKFVDNI